AAVPSSVHFAAPVCTAFRSSILPSGSALLAVAPTGHKSRPQILSCSLGPSRSARSSDRCLARASGGLLRPPSPPRSERPTKGASPESDRVAPGFPSICGGPNGWRLPLRRWSGSGSPASFAQQVAQSNSSGDTLWYIEAGPPVVAGRQTGVLLAKRRRAAKRL